MLHTGNGATITTRGRALCRSNGIAFAAKKYGALQCRSNKFSHVSALVSSVPHVLTGPALMNIASSSAPSITPWMAPTLADISTTRTLAPVPFAERSISAVTSLIPTSSTC